MPSADDNIGGPPPPRPPSINPRDQFLNDLGIPTTRTSGSPIDSWDNPAEKAAALRNFYRQQQRQQQGLPPVGPPLGHYPPPGGTGGGTHPERDTPRTPPSTGQPPSTTPTPVVGQDYAAMLQDAITRAAAQARARLDPAVLEKLFGPEAISRETFGLTGLLSRNPAYATRLAEAQAAGAGYTSKLQQSLARMAGPGADTTSGLGEAARAAGAGYGSLLRSGVQGEVTGQALQTAQSDVAGSQQAYVSQALQEMGLSGQAAEQLTNIMAQFGLQAQSGQQSMALESLRGQIQNQLQDKLLSQQDRQFYQSLLANWDTLQAQFAQQLTLQTRNQAFQRWLAQFQKPGFWQSAAGGFLSGLPGLLF